VDHIPNIVGVHLLSDLAIFLAYTAIAIAILLYLKQRQFESKQFTYLGLWFCAFFFLCGVTHLVQIVTLWTPVYKVQGYIKLLTGVVSWITAVIIFLLIPKALAIPTPAKYENALVKLEEANDHLALCIEEKTSELQNMMHETAHRCKNLLAVVQGILSLSRPVGEIKDVLAAVEGRIMCLSTSVDMLISNKWQTTSILTVINGQLEPFTILENANVSGPELQLNPTQVQYLSLALYELATNSTKFEVKVGVGARYKITWHYSNEDFKFIWHEVNSRAIEPPTTEGFGHHLLKQIVPAAFKGKAQLTFSKYYVNYILEAKIPGRAVESESGG